MKSCKTLHDNSIGTWVQISSPEICELAGFVGFDFIIIDMEHGSFGWDGLMEMIRAVDCTESIPIVRLAGLDKASVKKALDAGAHGIIIPSITTAEEAIKAVKYLKYEPHGLRGACPCTRATKHGTMDWNDCLNWAKHNTFIWVMIEKVSAINNIDAILKTEIDGIVLGPFDLSMDMGHEGNFDHPEVQNKLQNAADKAIRQNIQVVVPLFVDTPSEISIEIRKWTAKGCNTFVISGDRFLLSSGWRDICKTSNGILINNNKH